MSDIDRPSELIVVIVLFAVLGLSWFFFSSFIGILIGLILPNIGGLTFWIGAVFFVLCFAVVAGLYMIQEWAHISALVISALSLFLFPVGTVLGLICIWLLLRDDVKEALEQDV